MAQRRSGDSPPSPAPSETVKDLVGQDVGGYQVTACLGEGPTGQVYRCEDLLGASQIMKVLHPELSTGPALDRYRADLEKLSALGNEQIVLPVDTGDTNDGRFYLIFDELAGEDLADALGAAGEVDPERARELLDEVCRLVEAAHSASVVHGAIKPRNIFLEAAANGARPRVRLLDCAIGRLSAGSGRKVVLGDPTYMAPEQFSGQTDAASDVYSVGVLLYRLHAGQPPFAGSSNAQIMMRHLSEPPPPAPGIEGELKRVLLRALQKAPGARYSSLTRLREALERCPRNQPVVAAAFLHGGAATDHSSAQQISADAPRAGRFSEPGKHTNKQESMKLAETSKRPSPAPPPEPSAANGQNDSVEASLEDFISQANKSFHEPSDGWTLNTDEVELVDEEDMVPAKPERIAAAVKGGSAGTKKTVAMGKWSELAPADAKPAAAPAPKVEAPRPEAELAAKARSAEEKARKDKKEKEQDKKNGTAQMPTAAERVKVAPVASAGIPTKVDIEKSTVAQQAEAESLEEEPEEDEATMVVPSDEREAAMETQPEVISEEEGEPEPAPEVRPAPVKRSITKTSRAMTAQRPARVTREEQAAPVPQPVAPQPTAPVTMMTAPATSNPLVLFGVMFGAFVLGAIVVWFFIRTMAPPVPATPQYPYPMPQPGMAAPVAAPAGSVMPPAAVAPSAVAMPTAPPVAAAIPPAVAATAQPTGSAPVVTPLPQPQPLVTPLAPTAPPSAPAPIAAKPAHVVRHKAHAEKPVVVTAPPPDDAPRPAHAARPAAPKPAATAAPKPASAKPAKKEESGWVDPFAN